MPRSLNFSLGIWNHSPGSINQPEAALKRFLGRFLFSIQKGLRISIIQIANLVSFRLERAISPILFVNLRFYLCGVQE